MSKLKTNKMKFEHKKVVVKHQDNGRTYNYVDGSGWSHYTKGFKRRSATAKQLSDGYTFLLSFLSNGSNILNEEKEK